MLPTPVLSVSGKGFARLRISAWHFSPAPPILYAVRAIVYHKSRVLSRVLRDFSGSEAPGTPRLNRRRHLLSLPLWCSQGAEPARHWLDLPLWRPAGGLLCLPPVAPAFSLLSCPLSPAPFPGGEGGVLRLFYARGSAPCIPGAEPARHWGRGRTMHPAGVCLRNLQLDAKPTEPPFYWQCRQPRRGGTGGEGTIRRKRRRRLRWSSPPGQGEQVPQGEHPPCPPAKKGGEPRNGILLRKKQESGKITRTAPAFSADADSGQRHFP